MLEVGHKPQKVWHVFTSSFTKLLFYSQLFAQHSLPHLTVTTTDGDDAYLLISGYSDYNLEW